MVTGVIGYHVLAAADVPDVTVVAHLEEELLDVVVGFAEDFADLLRARRFSERAQAFDDLLPLLGDAVLLGVSGYLPSCRGRVPGEGELLLLLDVPARDVEVGVDSAPLAVEHQRPVGPACESHGT